ncbi:carboxypeptidase-like regulatory domain-containing protein [Phnomibacter sp. MR]|uniref:carboxypeptidase-like regulatory domain-containing protein n=1 Tax=Phnomibacter sp. MR TaxID=3042318 RepID=UPI003A7F8612
MMKKLSLFLMVLFVSVSHLAFSQKTVSGKVSDATNGKPLEGVTVSVKGTSVGTSTNADGSFSFVIPEKAAILVFSSVGFREKEVAVSANLSSIQLSPSSGDLGEVVVVGYGTTLKKELTGTVARVKGSEVANMPVPNLNQALQGRAAGVFVESENGKVGEGRYQSTHSW